MDAFNPFTAMGDLIDFTLSNARRFYSSKGENLAAKGLRKRRMQPMKVKTQNQHLICQYPFIISARTYLKKHLEQAHVDWEICDCLNLFGTPMALETCSN